MRFGDQVKIEDIGVLATYIKKIGDEVELEMFGVRFWLPERCVSLPFLDEDDEAA